MIRALAAAGAAIIAVVSASAPAAARQREVVVIAAGPPVVATFDGIPVNNPSASELNPEPSDCGDVQDASVLTAACDNVPLTIIVPDVDDADDFFVEISVTWEPSDEVDGTIAANDLDVYLYDNHQIARREAPTSNAWTQVGSSTGAVQPEVIKIFRPELGDYNMVVNNWSGVNVSYTVTGRIVIGEFEPPFEALAPNFQARPPASADEGDEAPPVDLSAALPSDPGVAVGFIPPAAPVLGDVAVLPDDDFSSFIDEGEFESALQAPQQAIPAGALRLRAAKPVSAPVLLFWFVLVPVALLAGAFVLLRRRSPLSFSVR